MADRRRRLADADRRRYLEHARDLFNRGEFWLAHEALETVWRSIIKDSEARVWQGFIQAAAALLHRARGNRHGTVVVGAAALERLAGPQQPEIEYEMVDFRAQLARALAGEGNPPRLEFTAHD
jgi:predicted metal-dependent hydrolase